MKKTSIIIYKFIESKNDIEYINELDNARQVADYFNIKNARQYLINELSDNISDNIKHLIKGKYLAIKTIIDEYDENDEKINVLYSI